MNINKYSAAIQLFQSFSSKENIESVGFPKYLAIFNASTVDGIYRQASIELMVCLLTPTAEASSCCVISLMARSTLTLFFISPQFAHCDIELQDIQQKHEIYRTETEIQETELIDKQYSESKHNSSYP